MRVNVMNPKTMKVLKTFDLMGTIGLFKFLAGISEPLEPDL